MTVFIDFSEGNHIGHRKGPWQSAWVLVEPVREAEAVRVLEQL